MCMRRISNHRNAIIKMKIIINADDCGMSKVVNSHIEQVITKGKITSTTIMANMADFDGAVNLYKKYKDIISFGWHINLTEGEPLIYSQILLDKGFYVEKDGHIEMNGKSFWRKWITSEMQTAVREELLTQYTKLKDNGVNISHVDSHHHIHTSLPMLFVIPSLLKEIGINKVRRIRNNFPGKVKRIPRDMWKWLYMCQNRDLYMSDVFCYFKDFATNSMFVNGEIVELECHPGHPKYMEEEEMLLETAFCQYSNLKLINYNNI